MDKEYNFEYGKTYYFDRSGLTINESEIKTHYNKCIPVVEACCRLQLPKGFKFSPCSPPGMCFDLSGLDCIKTPILTKVTLPNCESAHPTECEVVAGYEIRVIGDLNFSISAPLSAICGCCFPVHSHTCCSKSVAVNKVISYTCCPKPCDKCEPCIDWSFAFFNICKEEDACGKYLQVTMGVALEYTGTCDCEDE